MHWTSRSVCCGITAQFGVGSVSSLSGIRNQSPEGQAKAYFESLDGDILDQLSVVFIEGECPGNDFRAAQLTKGIEHGNHIAQKFELGIRFVKI